MFTGVGGYFNLDEYIRYGMRVHAYAHSCREDMDMDMDMDMGMGMDMDMDMDMDVYIISP